MVDEKERFDSKWKKVGTCFEWQGPLDRDGYGSFYFRRMNRRAHRVGYFFAKGDIPEGYVVHHKCENRACVNPKHLEAVTQAENVHNSSKNITAINARKKRCKNGHVYDRKYGNQRSCSVCDSAKTARLRKKWRAEDTLNV